MIIMTLLITLHFSKFFDGHTLFCVLFLELLQIFQLLLVKKWTHICVVEISPIRLWYDCLEFVCVILKILHVTQVSRFDL